MKRFFVTLLLFSAPLVFVFIILECSLRNIKSGYEAKLKGLIKEGNQIEILITGTSHASDGINPAGFKQKAYNMAYGSQSILYDKEIILKYLPILPNLKYVLISIDYPSLYWGFNENIDYFYYRYYGINIRNKNYIKQNFSQFLFGYSPKPAMKLLANYYMHKNNDSLVDGYIGSEGTDKGNLSDLSGKERVSVFEKDIRSSEEHKFICHELDTLISILKQHNITPILVTAPCYKTFTMFLDPKISNENQAFIFDLQKKYNVFYVNSQNDPSYQENDFYNNDHLNRAGATRYALFLDSVIHDLPKQSLK